MLLDGIIADDYSDEYLEKLKILELCLQDKLSSGHNICNVKYEKVYQQMKEIHNANISEKL